MTTVAYLMDRFPGDEKQVKAVRLALAKYPEPLQHLVYHVLAAFFESQGKPVPLSHKALVRYGVAKLIDQAVADGWIDLVTPASKTLHLSREYRPSFKLLNRWTVNYAGGLPYNLMTGRKIRANEMQSKTDADIPMPDQTRTVLRQQNGVVIKNIDLTDAPERLIASRPSNHPANVGDINSLRACQMNARLHGGLVHEYRSISTGRLAEPYGPMAQSRSMTYAMFAKTGAHNYDLRAAHISILADILDSLDLNSQALRDYLADPSAKKRYAQQIGVSVACWKNILCALINGASCLATRYARIHKLAIWQYLLDDAQGDEDKAEACFQRMMLATGALRGCLDAWKQFLASLGQERVVTPYFQVACKAGTWVLVNAMGCQIALTESNSRISSYVLQGVEQAFIQLLQVISGRHGFIVLANMHDGLITDEVIPAAAVEEAKRVTSFSSAVLVEKPFELSDKDKGVVL